MQTKTIPFTVDDTAHSVRAELKGLRHNIFLDDRLCICHTAKPANDCAVYVIPFGGAKVELFVQNCSGEWEITLYVDDRSADPADALPLSQRLEFLATASDITFQEHCSRVWQPAALRWSIWWIACVIIFSLIGGGKPLLWGATAGFGLVFALVALFLDLKSTYKLVRRFRTPSDCYQTTTPVSTILK